jgi:hypothetical protein
LSKQSCSKDAENCLSETSCAEPLALGCLGGLGGLRIYDTLPPGPLHASPPETRHVVQSASARTHHDRADHSGTAARHKSALFGRSPEPALNYRSRRTLMAQGFPATSECAGSLLIRLHQTVGPFRRRRKLCHVSRSAAPLPDCIYLQYHRSTKSVNQSIFDFVRENGRTYHRYQAGCKLPLPIFMWRRVLTQLSIHVPQ